MVNRWIGILAALGMLVANAAIFVYDVLPRWLPENPPLSEIDQLKENQSRYVQYGIYDDEDHVLGQSWTSSRRTTDGRVIVSTTTLLEPVSMPNGVTTPRVRVESLIVYRRDTRRVDDVDFRIHGLGVPICFRGESYAEHEFACRWQVGPQHDSFLLEGRTPAALGDVIRPFHRLPNLQVGQTWRVKLLDPLAQIFPQIKQTGLNLEPVQITVTRMERFAFQGTQVDAYVVEGGGATAWVHRNGQVLCQKIVVPLLGELRLLLEDACERDDARDLEGCEEIRAARQAAVRLVPAAGD